MFVRVVALAVTVALVPGVAGAAGFTLVAVGKTAAFRDGGPGQRSGAVRVGRDPALAGAPDPRCPASSHVDLESYPDATVRVVRPVDVVLDCAKWRPARGGWAYADPVGPVRAIRYGGRGIRIAFAGDAVALQGPVGYVQAQLTVGATRYRVRFHNFRRNAADAITTRRPTAAAAAGETGFWDVLTGADDAEAREAAVLATLEKAARHDRHDGWSRFLVAMLHLYRFAQGTTDFAHPGAAAGAELDAANVWFAKALPLVWDGVHGDSRVPGFAAGAKFMQGYTHGDPTLRAQGLADLVQANVVNGFFNVFDYIPVIQALPPSDPDFATAYGAMSTYLSDPATLACVTSQPEICANDGFGAHNVEGALTLFGDVYAKGGALASAQQFYGLAAAIAAASGWSYASLAADRAAHVADRVAAYRDGDAANDPPVIGTGAEACAVCHRR